MSRKIILALAFLALATFPGIAGATPLQVIGSATYLGEEYNLIYEEAQNLIWLDYTLDYREVDINWFDSMEWAAGLGAVLILNIDPQYTVTWLDGSWRLPSVNLAQANLNGESGWAGPDGTGYHDYEYGYNMVNSEMGYLYYESLGNLGYRDTDGNIREDYVFSPQNIGPFENLLANYYWTSTQDDWLEGSEEDYDRAYYFYTSMGVQRSFLDGNTGFCAMAVRSADVASAIVPEPATVLMFGGGLAALGLLRRTRSRKGGFTGPRT